MGLFDKKYCDICGEKIGLLGNRKLEDGNLCKACAKKLSPWFEERRHSTVDEIKKQLEYREENRVRAQQFSTTRSMGEFTKVLLDEDRKWLTVTSAQDLGEANPDILDFRNVTGCRMDIEEERTELKHDGPDGEEISYNPPQYQYSYDFYMVISVNNPYFDEMRFKLNSRFVELTSVEAAGAGIGFGRRVQYDPMSYPEYRNYYNMADEICQTIRSIQNQTAEQRKNTTTAAVAEQNPGETSWICPSCDAKNEGQFCECCGTKRP